MLTLAIAPPPPPPPALTTPTLSIVRPDDATHDAPPSLSEPSLSDLEATAILAGSRWIEAVQREAIAAIHEPGLRGVFSLEVRRTETNFQRAINILHADGPPGAASRVHFEAHRMARKAVGQ